MLGLFPHALLFKADADRRNLFLGRWESRNLMNTTIRRILTANSLSRRLYFAARQAYGIRRVERGAGRYFLNTDEFKSALRARGGTTLVDLRTTDGLTITMRRNYGDAMT